MFTIWSRSIGRFLAGEKAPEAAEGALLQLAARWPVLPHRKHTRSDDEWDETYHGSQIDWSPTASEWNPSESAADDESLFGVEEFDPVYCIC